MYSIHCPVGVFSALLFLFSNVFAVNDTPSIFIRAERLFADSQYLSALETYRECINSKRFVFRQTNDDAAKAFYKIGLSYYRTANFSAAATAFEEYMRLYPGDGHFADALLMCARAYAACQDFKNASEEWYRAWIRGIISADRQTPLWEAAQCAEKDGNEQRAVAIYTEFLQKFPLDPRTTIAAPVCAELLVKQKKFSGAGAIIDAAEKQWSNNEALVTRLLYIKALSAKLQMKTETARRYYSALVNHNDDFPEKEQALTEYASMLAAEKQYKELMQVYKKIADLQQKNGRRPQWNFTLAWARCARNAESFDVAEKLLRQLLDANQPGEQTGRVLLELAECYLAKKDSGSALNVLQEIIADARHPDSLRAKAALAAGEAYCGEGLFPQAIAAYRAYCSIPGLIGADGVQYTIAALYQGKGLYATAIQEYDRFLRLYPQSPRYYDAVVNAGRCEEAMGHFSAALDRYEYAAQSDARPDIVEQAKKYKENAQRFGVVNIDGALVELERLAQKNAAGDSSRPDRLMRMAGIFENMLGDFSAALDLYDQAARCIPAPSDSVSALIIYCKATTWEKMYQKARFDRDSVKTASLKTKAAAGLQEAARLQRYPAIADDARYRLLLLGEPSVTDLERYCARPGFGGHVDEALMRIGDYYETKTAQGDGKAARKALDAYCRVARSGTDRYRGRALLSLARTWYMLDALDSASAAMSEYARRYPDSAGAAEGLYYAALIAKKQGNFSVAIVKFQSIIASYPFGPFAPRARFGVAAARLTSGNFAEALRDFRTYIQGYPGGENILEARLGTARCLARMEKNEDAGRILAELIKEQCSAALTGGIYYEWANYLKSKGDTHAALEFLRKAVAIDSFPDKGAAYASMGGLYFENSLYGDAARAFTRVLQGSSTESDSLTGLIGILTSQTMDGQESALEKYRDFFKKRFGNRNPRYGEVAYYEGLRALVDKKYEAAIKKFKSLAEMFGSSKYCNDAAYQIGLCYYYMGKQEKAFEVFHDCIAQYPGSAFAAMAHFKIGMMLHERGELLGAAEAFEKVVTSPGGDEKTRFRAAYNAAIDYQKNASWLEAARLYRVIIDSFSQEVAVASTNLKIGFCYIQASHFEDALKYFQKASAGAAVEEKPEIVYWTAQCWARLGDYQKAITEYLKVPAQFPVIGQWALTSQFEAARLYELTKDIKKAVALYKKIVASDGEKGVFGKDALAQCVRLTPFVKDN